MLPKQANIKSKKNQVFRQKDDHNAKQNFDGGTKNYYPG
jgi:hypothetical protein